MAYKGVVIALDAIIPKQKKGRRTEEYYRAELAKMDKQLVKSYDSAYECLCLFMGYRGVSSVGLAEDGLYEAETIIDWVETQLKQ